MTSCTQSFIQVQGNISSRFPNNSEANTSELLGNLEEMVPWYYMHTV